MIVLSFRRILPNIIPFTDRFFLHALSDSYYINYLWKILNHFREIKNSTHVLSFCPGVYIYKIRKKGFNYPFRSR